MSKIALKDVVHYYLGINYWTNNSQGNLNAHTLPYVLDMIKQGKGVQLWLRRLEDMTQEQYKALENSLSIDITFSVKSLYLYWKDKPKHVTVIINRLVTNNLSFNDGLILLKEGFDLFGLIESGQAVDAKTLNP